MGGVGSDAAIEAADIVIMNDEPSKVITAIQIAKKDKNHRLAEYRWCFECERELSCCLEHLVFATMWEAVFR